MFMLHCIISVEGVFAQVSQVIDVYASVYPNKNVIACKFQHQLLLS